MNADEFAAWAEASSWSVAKTMPEVPHEYTVLADDQSTFAAVKRFIADNGFLAMWRRHPAKPYYVLDGRLYWVIFPVVNRCVLGDPRTDVEPVSDAESRGLDFSVVGDPEQARQGRSHTDSGSLLDKQEVSGSIPLRPTQIRKTPAQTHMAAPLAAPPAMDETDSSRP